MYGLSNFRAATYVVNIREARNCKVLSVSILDRVNLPEMFLIVKQIVFPNIFSTLKMDRSATVNHGNL